VKKLLRFTTSLCSAVLALGLGGASAAFAETGETGGMGETDASQYYPATFEIVPSFENLEDYAVGDGKVLFLQKNCVYEYGDERVTTYENSRKTVTSLYFEDGAFYYGTNDGKYYALSNFNSEENPEITDFVSTTETEDILLANKYNYYLSDGNYYFLDKNRPSEPSVLLDGFSNLKRYGETVYAVKENVLYELNGTESAAVKVENFKLTQSISTGNAYNALTSPATQAPLFVNLTGGAHMTEVDLDKLEETSSTFVTGDTVKVTEPTALLLYTAGNDAEGISIIAVNGKSYLIHPKDTAAKTVYPFADTEFTDGTATEGYVYSAPFESKGTRVAKLPYGTNVTILNVIKMADNAELDHDFYHVRYQIDETNSVEGYVRSGLLSTYTFNEDPPVATADPEETYGDLIKPVVLVLIVLLLIAIAAGYLIYIGTSDKRKKKNTSETNDSSDKDK